jgi:hypothetical protein
MPKPWLTTEIAAPRFDPTTRAAAARPTGVLHRERRSLRFVDALRRLDPGTGRTVEVDELVETLRSEFPLGCTVPIGYLARCYLGDPFEVHTLDLAGRIVEHARVGEPLPVLFAPARRLALHPAYLAIEVYPDRLLCIREDGAAVEVPQ